MKHKVIKKYDRNSWWASMMFDYVYPDGESIPQDIKFEGELMFIARVFSEIGLMYCVHCEYFVSKYDSHRGCDF
jgi:hypothetical protein